MHWPTTFPLLCSFSHSGHKLKILNSYPSLCLSLLNKDSSSSQNSNNQKKARSQEQLGHYTSHYFKFDVKLYGDYLFTLSVIYLFIIYYTLFNLLTFVK